ncbi:MAG TPA: roadblock/LC7 domain-containing protein [Ilumatobacter sp.]|nr:roadblock/LC7 domain-containing protein [Ilumatobacter sp.]
MIEASMRELIDHVVDGVPGVFGALVATTDGFLIASRLPENEGVDPAAVAAMSASSLALATRLVQLGGPTPAKTVLHRSAQAQVCVFAVGTTAVLTIVAESRADTERIERIGYEVSWGLVRALEDQPLE